MNDPEQAQDLVRRDGDNAASEPQETIAHADSAPVEDNGDPQPEQIGRYRVERLLGKGGFGLVYLAHDEHLDRPVAIKVPHAKLISGPEDAEAYLTEARTVANLDHPNIVPVHDVGSTDDCPCYIVSKYIKGPTLRRSSSDPVSSTRTPPNWWRRLPRLCTTPTSKDSFIGT